MRMTNPLVVMNHLFFGSLLLLFVIQHSAIVPSPIKYGPAVATHAMNYQPRTPPPMLDYEQLNTSLEEAEVPQFGVVIR